MKKTILTILISNLIVGGIVFGATTYTDVTPVKMVEEEPVVVEDVFKDIEKEWSETKTETFTVTDKKRKLNNLKETIDNSIVDYNAIIDELTGAKSTLDLDVTIPSKISISIPKVTSLDLIK